MNLKFFFDWNNSYYRGILRRLARKNFPIIPGVYRVLLLERRFRQLIFRVLVGKLYREPLFRLMCNSVGEGLYLYEEIPKIIGNLRIDIGRNCGFEGNQTWIAGGPAGTMRTLTVGDGSYLGYGVQVVSGDSIVIGKSVLIANRVKINGYDGHPIDPLARARGDGPGERGSGAILIDDYAWIGNDVTILKNVRIGRGAVVGSGSVVVSSVPDLTMVAGVPAKVIRTIDAPYGWENTSFD